jgi:hypothetical protein
LYDAELLEVLGTIALGFFRKNKGMTEKHVIRIATQTQVRALRLFDILIGFSANRAGTECRIISFSALGKQSVNRFTAEGSYLKVD